MARKPGGYNKTKTQLRDLKKEDLVDYTLEVQSELDKFELGDKTGAPATFGVNLPERKKPEARIDRMVTELCAYSGLDKDEILNGIILDFLMGRRKHGVLKASARIQTALERYGD